MKAATHGPLTGWSLAVILIALLCGCDPGTEGAGESQALTQGRPDPSHLVKTLVVRRTPLTGSQERPGSLRYRKLVRIHTQEEGRVTALPVFEGDQVEQGQTLARLEDEMLKAEFDKAKATQAQKQLDLRRLEDLRRTRSASEDEAAQAATALAVAQADLRLLEIRLGFTRILAPFTGVITERLVEPGDFVTKNTHLLSLADPASLVAEIHVSELLLPQLRVGDEARLRIDALGTSDLKARIQRIHPRLEEVSRQGTVELTLDALPGGARAGQFVRATLETAALERTLIPLRALQRDREGEFVWVVGPQTKASRRPVRSGLRIVDGVEILDGLSPGEQIVTRGFLGLTEGKSVKVVAG